MPGLFSMFNNGAMRPPVSYGPGAAMGSGQLQPMPGMGPDPVLYGGPPGTAMGTGSIAPIHQGAGPMAATNMGMIGNLGMPGGAPVPAMGQAGNDIMSKLKMQGLRQRMGGLGPQLLAQGARPGGLMSMFGQVAGMAPQFRRGGLDNSAAREGELAGRPAGGGLLGSIGSLFGRR